MKYGFVYIWFDRKHKRYYIGCHWGTVDDGYICSSSWMKQAYKRRSNDFKRRILKTNILCRKQLLEEEYYWLSMTKKQELKIRYYNLHNRHFSHWVTNNDSLLSVGQKISKSRTGKTYSKRGPHTQETKDKIRDKLKGVKIHKDILLKRIGNKREKYKQVSCPHCNTIGSGGPMNLWHFNNCKDKI